MKRFFMTAPHLNSKDLNNGFIDHPSNSGCTGINQLHGSSNQTGSGDDVRQRYWQNGERRQVRQLGARRLLIGYGFRNPPLPHFVGWIVIQVPCMVVLRVAGNSSAIGKTGSAARCGNWAQDGS
jgi:hypothetical protein